MSGTEGKLKLNIASYTVMFRDWVNIDKVDLSVFAEKNGFKFQQLDARKGLPYKDNTVDLIVTSHFLEHLNPFYETIPFLQECFRVLKKDGIMRVAVPDLWTLIMAYMKKRMKTFDYDQPLDYQRAETDGLKFSLLMYGTLSKECTSESYTGHMACYDYPALKEMLEAGGFKDIKKMSYGISQSQEIQSETADMFPSHSLYVEARK